MNLDKNSIIKQKRKEQNFFEKIENWLQRNIKIEKISWTAIIAILTAFVGFSVYLYNQIYFCYYSIDIQYYNPSIQQTIYTIILYTLYCTFLMLIIHSIYKSRNNKGLFLRLVYYTITIFIFTLISTMVFSGNWNWFDFFIEMLANIILSIVFEKNILDFLNRKGNIYEIKQEIENNTMQKTSIIVYSIITMGLLTIVIVLISFVQSVTKTNFKIIYNEEIEILEKKKNAQVECDVILYCNNNTCITTKGKIDKINDKYKLKLIDIDKKKNIDIQSISYKKYTFSKIPKISR